MHELYYIIDAQHSRCAPSYYSLTSVTNAADRFMVGGAKITWQTQSCTLHRTWRLVLSSVSPLGILGLSNVCVCSWNKKTWHLYTSAAITTVTRVSVTIAGALAHDDVACFEYIASPPPHTRTHTGTHTASIRKRCNINLTQCCLCPGPSFFQVYVRVNARICEYVRENDKGC